MGAGTCLTLNYNVRWEIEHELDSGRIAKNKDRDLI